MESSIEIIKKYNISNQDLYILGIIENKKVNANFFEKEKLKGKTLRVLKSYNVKFIDLGNLLSAIKEQEYNTNRMLIDKYGDIDLDSIKTKWIF